MFPSTGAVRRAMGQPSRLERFREARQAGLFDPGMRLFQLDYFNLPNICDYILVLSEQG
jgi:hypothetical protein